MSHLALILAAAFLLLLLGFARHAIGNMRQRDHRAWGMRWRILFRRRPGPGFATFTELAWRWSKARAALDHGRRARPSMGRWACLTTRTTDYAVRLGRGPWGKRIFTRMQDQTLILAPQQVGKSGMLADRIIDHPGPVICTSTRADLFRNTAGERYRRGPVHVFNPLGIGGIPSTFGWDILDGCENPGTAIRRAQDLTGDYVTGDLQWWQSKASAALAGFLHAAALAPWADITTVYEWVAGMGDIRAVQVLETAPNASPALLAVISELRKGDKTSNSVRATISESLTWLAVPEIAAAAAPQPDDGFSIADFIASNGVLYMIAPGDETAPVAPLVQAFVQHVHYEAGLIASRLPAGKLDPPMWYALDELTQVCPVPLPRMLADSAGWGCLITAVVHSYGQLEGRYGKTGAEVIWSTTAKVLMGGITDPVTLEHMTRVCGIVGDDRVPAVPPDLLRMLPKWRALVLGIGPRPIVVKTRPVWHRRNRRFGRAPVPVPVLVRVPAPRIPELSEEAKRYAIPDPSAWPSGAPAKPAVTSNGASSEHAS